MESMSCCTGREEWLVCTKVVDKSPTFVFTGHQSQPLQHIRFLTEDIMSFDLIVRGSTQANAVRPDGVASQSKHDTKTSHKSTSRVFWALELMEGKRNRDDGGERRITCSVAELVRLDKVWYEMRWYRSSVQRTLTFVS